MSLHEALYTHGAHAGELRAQTAYMRGVRGLDDMFA